jgi:hypothetical protein
MELTMKILESVGKFLFAPFLKWGIGFTTPVFTQLIILNSITGGGAVLRRYTESSYTLL